MKPDPRHPLLTPRHWPKFWVPPVTHLADKLNVALEFNRHGIIDFGLGRIGKSTAIDLLHDSAHWCSYRYVWLRTIAGKAKQPSEGYFFNNLRLTADLKVRERSSTFCVHHLTNHLCEWADEENADFIILSIDDANRLFHEDYDHLVTLDNHVALRGQRLFALLMVQSDADQSTVPTIDKERHPSQITGRFTADECTYHGLRGTDEIRVALKTLGDLVWSGRTILETFALHALESNWHIEQQAHDFLTAVETVRAQHGLPVDEPLAMSPFMGAGYWLLVRVAGEDPHFERYTMEQLVHAIELSGLVELEKSRRPKDLQ